MHITVACPRCKTRYQLDPSLRGQKISCPNRQCRNVFEVQEVGAAAPAAPRPAAAPPRPAAPTPAASGNVGDFVPVVQAQAAAPSPAVKPPAPAVPPAAVVMGELIEDDAPTVTNPPTPDWRSAPPPPRRTEPGTSPPVGNQVALPPAQPAEWPPTTSSRPTKAPVDAQVADWRTGPPPRADEAAAGGPEVKYGGWDAPPVRHPDAAPAEEVLEPVEGYDGAEAAEEVYDLGDNEDAEMLGARRKKRRARILLVAIPLFLLLVLGGAAAGVVVYLRGEEARVSKAADALYREGQFNSAAGRFRELKDKFPDSALTPRHAFLAEWSELCNTVTAAGYPPEDALKRLREFHNTHGANPLLKEFGKDVGVQMTKALRGCGEIARAQPNAVTLALLDQAEQDMAAAERVNPGGVPDKDRFDILQLYTEARQVVAQAEQRRKFVEQLRQLGEKQGAEGVREVERFLQANAAAHPDWVALPDVAEVRQKVFGSHQAQVSYLEEPAKLEKPPAEDQEPSLIADTLVSKPGAPVAPSGQVWFALARGVLYAVSQDNGAVRWAMRVGVDTTALPLRLSASGARPELALIVSADTQTLSAVDPAEGRPLWSYRLGAPCLGQPVIVEPRLYIPTYDGQIHEIEMSEGKLLGRYNLGKDARLRVGGVRQEGTKRLFFPADDYCIYVIDVGREDKKQKPVDMILYTRHASGSLRTPPVVVSVGGADGGVPQQGYLILSQAEGLNNCLLRAFALPVTDPLAAPLTMNPEPRVAGWPWFSPYCDGEKLVLATDAGRLGLFGVRQERNRDNPLFQLYRGEVTLGSGTRPGRAQVVHGQENTFWVIAEGLLQKWRLSPDREKGRKLVSLWAESPLLGSPLHPAQVDESESTLFLVTQAPNGHAVLATAVDAETGEVKWQRQLGLVPQGDPVALGNEVLALDPGGGLSLFDVRKYRKVVQGQWLVGSQAIAPPLVEGTSAAPHVVPAADGKSVFEVAAPLGTRLIARQFVPAAAGQRFVLEETKLELPAPLAGTPAALPDALLMPLADGKLFRVSLPLKGSAGRGGPDWRATKNDPDAIGHVVYLQGNQFAVTDGHRGITVWNWPANGIWATLPPGRDLRNPTRRLDSRIASAPLVLPTDANMPLVRLLVVDIQGGLTLLEGDGLEVKRRWELDGRVTSGPFLRGGQVGVVVERRRLVWLDVSKEKPLWEYEAQGEGVVGQPQLVEGRLLVAEESGRFVALHPATGKPSGKGYTLRANVAPASTPTAFGPGRAFAPLTDGTALLLSLEHFK